jgi:hypothetical protein
VLVAVINGLMLYLVCKKMFRMVVQDKSFGTLAIRR